MHVTSAIIVINLLLMVYKNFMRHYAVFSLDDLVVGTEWAASNMTYSVTSRFACKHSVHSGAESNH